MTAEQLSAARREAAEKQASQRAAAQARKEKMLRLEEEAAKNVGAPGTLVCRPVRAANEPCLPACLSVLSACGLCPACSALRIPS